MIWQIQSKWFWQIQPKLILTNTTLSWSSQRRGIRYCKCSPMREFAPAWKYRIMIILGCSRYCKGCKGENLKLWKHWQPLRVFIDRPLKSLAYLAQWERWGRSKKRENQEHFLLKAQTIVSRGSAAFLLYPSAVILANSMYSLSTTQGHVKFIFAAC